MFYDLYINFAGSYLHGMLAALLLCYLSYKGLGQMEVAENCCRLAKNYRGPFSADFGDLDEVNAIKHRQRLVFISSTTAGVCGLIFTTPLLPPYFYPVTLSLALLISFATQQVLMFTVLRVRCYTGT